MISSVTLSSATSSSWIPVDYTQSNFNLGVAVVSSGTLTWKIEVTLDNPLDPSITPNAITAPDPLNTGSGGLNEAASITIPCRAVRLTVGTYASGSATITVIQGRN